MVFHILEYISIETGYVSDVGDKHGPSKEGMTVRCAGSVWTRTRPHVGPMSLRSADDSCPSFSPRNTMTVSQLEQIPTSWPLPIAGTSVRLLTRRLPSIQIFRRDAITRFLPPPLKFPFITVRRNEIFFLGLDLTFD